MTPTSNQTIHDLLQAAFPQAKINVSGDGYQYQVHITEPSFAGVSIIERHKRVYAVLQAQIASGNLHALSIDARASE